MTTKIPNNTCNTNNFFCCLKSSNTKIEGSLCVRRIKDESCSIHLETSMFDILKEDENPVNPIYGQSLLKWLQEQLNDKYEFAKIDYEDWGWYCDINFNNRTYMLGSSVFFEEGDDPKSELEWVFQVHKQRSFKEVLLFKEKMTTNDDCFQFFKAFFNDTNGIKVLTSEEIA